MNRRNKFRFTALSAAIAITLFSLLNEAVTAKRHEISLTAAGNPAADGVALKNGKGKFMPSFKSKLSEEETGAVVQRVRAFGKGK